MSGYLRADIDERPRAVGIGGLMQGIIWKPPTDMSSTCTVRTRQFENKFKNVKHGVVSYSYSIGLVKDGSKKIIATQMEWPDVVWQARDSTSLPAKGDACLFVIDDMGQGWVLAWWPWKLPTNPPPLVGEPT